MSKELTLDEKLVAAGITNIPADTDESVKETLLAQAEKTKTLEEEKQRIAEEATAEIKKARESIAEAKKKAAPESYGSFTYKKTKYDIVRKQVQVKGEDDMLRIITAEELADDKDLQEFFVVKGFTMVKAKGGK